MSQRNEYLIITDEQRAVLNRFFDNGMTSTASAHMVAIKKACEETSLPVERVKV